ncbi:DUF2637 domain-containing protein [Streptomyces yangpuensis]|uniref:DUF2637 domain-containing protein n=1 Tax=Streptomyces yangpuensis TaxID=1648182 RepID=UPI00371F8905
MTRKGRIALVVGLVAVVLMAFRVSWNALSDVARAIGADPTAALLYPIVVDGLMALALVAALVLTGPDRKFALRVLAAYTIASLLLNYVHGLIPALHTESVQWGRLADWAPANWALVLLATSLPVGSIYFGSDLVAKVLHHNPESADRAETPPDQSGNPPADKSASEEAPQSRSDQAEPDPGQPTESTAMKVTEPPATRPTEPDTPAPAPAARTPRSAAVAESTGSAPRRATGRVPAAAKSTADRTRADAQVLAEAQLLTAGWSDDRLTAERLRSELRIGQNRARALRDQLQAERTSQAQPVEYHDSKVEVPDGRDEAASPSTA